MADSRELVPIGPVRRRAHPCRSISTVHKTFHVESLLAPEHVINGAGQFVSQCGQSFRLPVFLFQPSQVRLTFGVVAKEPYGGFRERPLQMRVADLVARGAIEFARGFFLGFHQAAIRREILDARETGDIVNLVKKNQSEDFADARNRIQKVKRVGIVLPGMT